MNDETTTLPTPDWKEGYRLAFDIAHTMTEHMQKLMAVQTPKAIFILREGDEPVRAFTEKCKIIPYVVANYTMTADELDDFFENDEVYTEEYADLSILQIDLE